MKDLRIPKIDPHIDIADLFNEYKLNMNDFYSNNDLPVTLPKLITNNVKIIGATLYFDRSFLKTSFFDGVNSYYNWYSEMLKNNKSLYTIKKFSDIISDNDKIGIFFSIEGFECIRSSYDFDYFYNLGVRSFGLTWSYENEYACGRHTQNDTGLTSKGIEIVKNMNGKPLIIDIAHLSEKSVLDVNKYFKGMIVTTHSNAKSVHNTKHNLTDDEIDIIVERNGVVSLLPLTEDTGDKGTMDEFYNHLDYIIQKWGIDYVSIASDIFPTDEYPFLENYKDISILNAIEDYLLTKLSKQNVKKLFFDNWLRVLSQSLS